MSARRGLDEGYGADLSYEGDRKEVDKDRDELGLELEAGIGDRA